MRSWPPQPDRAKNQTAETACGRRRFPDGRRAAYGAAPPASRLLRIASATALRADLDPGDLCGPSGRRYGQAQPAPAQQRGASDGPLPGGTTNARHYVNWRSIVRKNGEITRIRYEEVSTV